MVQTKRKFSRRSKALFWLTAVGIAVGAMIFLEQIPLLYVLVTVVLVGLLIVVGYSNLEKVGRRG